MRNACRKSHANARPKPSGGPEVLLRLTRGLDRRIVGSTPRTFEVLTPSERIQPPPLNRGGGQLGISIPFAIYDFIGVLFPGVVAIALVSLVYPPALPSTTTLFREFPLFALVAGYVTGEIIQALARAFERRVVWRLWKRPSKWESLAPELQALLERATRDHFSLGDQFSDKDFQKARFDLLYSMVWDRMDNYRLFVANADFSRAAAMVGAMGAVVALCAGISGSFGPKWGLPVLLLVAFVSLLSAALLFSRARYFRELADGVVYFSVLQRVTELRNQGTHVTSSEGGARGDRLPL